jgi:hypothetical protein
LLTPVGLPACGGKLPRARYLAETSACLSACLAIREKDASCRPLQPTYFTSTRGSFRFLSASARAALTARPFDRNRWPSRRHASFRRPSPRWATRWTARTQLRSHLPPLVSETEKSEALLTAALPDRGVIDHVPSWRPTSDIPCRASTSRGNPRGLEEPEPLPPRARQSARFSRSRTSSIDECSEIRFSPVLVE